MASAGLLGALAGLGDGMKTAGEAMWKEAIQKDRDERLAEIESNNADYKAEKELDVYKQKAEYDKANPSAKDRYMQIDPEKNLFDRQKGEYVGGESSVTSRWYKDAGFKSEESGIKELRQMVTRQLGADNDTYEPDKADIKPADLYSRALSYLRNAEEKNIGAAVSRGYSALLDDIAAKKESAKKNDVPDVEPGSYDPPGLDLWGQRESADSTEIVLDLESQIMKGEIKGDNKSLSQYLNGTMNSSIAKKVLADIEARSKARDALAKGKDRNLVIERLESQGFSSYGL